MRKTFSTEELCDAFEVSRSSYYAWKQAKPTKRSIENRQIVEAIKVIHLHRHMKSYGSPRMTEELKSRGFQCGRHRVTRLMREQGLNGGFYRTLFTQFFSCNVVFDTLTLHDG